MYEAALNAKVRIEELQKQIDNHTEDKKVTATVNDVAESVERLNWCACFKYGRKRYRTFERIS